jgi:hypothetical protein
VSVAASAPLIRPLFTRTRKPSGDTLNGRSFEMSQFGSRKGTRLSGNEEAGLGSSSQENILGLERGKLSSDIVMDRSFEVTYDKVKKHESSL